MTTITIQEQDNRRESTLVLYTVKINDGEYANDLGYNLALVTVYSLLLEEYDESDIDSINEAQSNGNVYSSCSYTEFKEYIERNRLA